MEIKHKDVIKILSKLFEDHKIVNPNVVEMNEGELKKRINAKSNWIGADTWETQIIEVEDLDEILNEATKNIFELIVKDCITDEIIISDEEEMIVRLKKWFGARR